MVERLVYTERVGGSKPSPPSLLLPIADLRFAICDTEILRVLPTNVGVEISREHLLYCGFAVDLCRIEKGNAVVFGIAENKR